VAADSSDVPIACTLDDDDIPDRLADWQSLLRFARTRSTLPGGARRLEFGSGSGLPVVDLVRLVVAEQECCSFFSFSVTVDGRGIGLEVDAPAEARELVTQLLG